MQKDLKGIKYRAADASELALMRNCLARAKDPAGRLLIPAVVLMCLMILLNTLRLRGDWKAALILSGILAAFCAAFLIFRSSLTKRYRKLVAEGKAEAVSAVCLEKKKTSEANAASDRNMSRTTWVLSTEFGETVKVPHPVHFGVSVKEGDRCLIAALDHKYHMIFGIQ